MASTAHTPLKDLLAQLITEEATDSIIQSALKDLAAGLFRNAVLRCLKAFFFVRPFGEDLESIEFLVKRTQMPITQPADR
jgi:hypothetical protein